MSAGERKQLLLQNLSHIISGLLCTNFGEAWRPAEGMNASEKVLSLMTTLGPAADISAAVCSVLLYI